MRRTDKPIFLPILAAALALVLTLRDAKAETVRGLDGKGRAYVCERNVTKQLIEFCVYFPADPRARR